MLAGCPSDPANPTYPYICTNGTPAAGTNASAGLERCASCADGYGLTPAARCAPIGSAIAVDTEDAFSVGETSPTDLAAIGDTLYMVGDTTDRLYTLDTNTGVATQMGTATAFGVGETSPTGLGSIGDTLYMVGIANARLYTLNTADGTATRVGTSNSFGVGEDDPRGLAAIGNTLYMVGDINNRLYMLNIDTTSSTAGRATAVGTTAAGFGVFEVTPTGLAVIGNTLYMVGDNTDRLYTLNIDTTSSTAGAATPVGSQMQFGVNEANPLGLAAIGDTLYLTGSGRLYTLVLP